MKTFLQQEKTRHYLLLIILPILVLFPISFDINPMKYDMIDCFLPWRFNVSEHLAAGQLPFWNPYQDLGYPIQADPSSGAWYPIVWLFGSTIGYSIYTIGWEYIIHLIFAGIGFYQLLSYFKFQPKLALIGAIAYAFCGIFIGNAQHLPYTVSACWLPFLLRYFLQTQEEVNWKNPIKAAICLFLMITGGYPAFIIILFYLLLIFFIRNCYKNRQTYTRTDWFSLFARNLAIGILAIIFALPLFIALYQVSPYLSRLGKFELAEALFSPFSPQSFLSFLLPYGTSVYTDFFDSDLSMRNAYFGIILFVFFIPALFIKKPKTINTLFFYGLFSLTAAVGSYLPVRAFLFEWIPMMGIFRFPSVFRYFFILGAIPVSLLYIEKLFAETVFPFKKILLLFSSFTVIFIGCILLSRSKGYLNLKDFIHFGLFNAHEQATIWQHITIQSLIQIGLLSGVLVCWKYFKNYRFHTLIASVIFDVLLTTQLILPYTGIYDTIPANEGQQNLIKATHLKHSFHKNSIQQWNDYSGIGTPFWQNEAIFQHTLVSEGFNSFSFTNYENLENDHPIYFKALLSNRPVLLSDQIARALTIYQKEKDSTVDLSSLLFFNELDLKELKNHALKHNENDTVVLNRFTLTQFEISSQVKHMQLLTLFQKNYTGWKAYCGGKALKIYESSGNFMSVIIPKGKHNIIFRYDNPLVRWAWIISWLSLILSLVFLLKPKRTNL